MRPPLLIFAVLLISIVRSQPQPYLNSQSQSGQYQGSSYQNSASSGYQSQQGNSNFRSQQFAYPPVGGNTFTEERSINVHENIQGRYNYDGGAGSARSYQYNQQSGNYGSQQGFQGGMMMGSRNNQAGRSVVVNTPLILDTSSTGVKGSQVDIKLTSYSNPNLALPNGTTCKCPSSSCNYIPPNQQNQCSFSFVIVISCADQSIQYIQSDFFPMPDNGVITTGNWTNQYNFLMTTRPVAIDVFVQHLGVVIATQNSQLLFFNHLTLVDSFVVDLLNFNSNSQSISLTGQQLHTQLQMNLNVQCINNMLGPNCDLQCGTASQGATAVICFSNRTNTYSACKWNYQKTQVTDCYVCTHGTYNGTCSGAYIITEGGGVAYAFRTWTIVLGCLLGIALLLILCLIISYIIVRNREYERTREIEKVDESTQFLIDNENKSNLKPTPIIPPYTPYRPPNQSQNQVAESEDSFSANGVQQTTISTTTTTRREHVV